MSGTGFTGLQDLQEKISGTGYTGLKDLPKNIAAPKVLTLLHHNNNT